MITIRLPAEAGGTRACIGPGAWGRLPAATRGRAVVVCADRHVFDLHGAALLAALAEPPRGVIALARGERAKRLSEAERCWRELARLRFPRSGLVVALGGGAALDVAGFVASTWMRGVPWIAVPTTLLAQADACFGGKTALDLREGKNLVGSFHPPRLALCEPEALLTQSPREFRAARFELLKCAWVGDPKLVRVALSEALVRRDRRAIAEAVARALAVKAALVARDPHDRGPRRKLNLGHTFGHALEQATGYRLRHGEAVGVGLLAALHAAEIEGLIRPASAARRRAELLALRPPSPGQPLLDAALEAQHLDKKKGARGLVLVLPGERGVVVREGLPRELFGQALARALAELAGARL